MAPKYTRIFVHRHYLFRDSNSFLRAYTSSRKYELWGTDRLQGQNLPGISWCEMEATVLIILQMLFAACAVLKIGEYPWMLFSFSWGIFSHMTCLDQSRTSKSIWWTIILDMIVGFLYYWCTEKHSYKDIN